MYNANYFKARLTSSVVVGSKNGATLSVVYVEETKKVHHWELFLDGELIDKYYVEKTAKLMFRDFSGS